MVTNQVLWDRIDRHSLDKTIALLPFTMRLAHDNKWPIKFGERVAAEYKRFIYLIALSNELLSPSHAVDQAWHLHLLDTRAYQAFCRDAVGRDVHHTPNDGEASQKDQFAAAYQRTLALYAAEFGEPPPSDIWPDSVGSSTSTGLNPQRAVAATAIGIGAGAALYFGLPIVAFGLAFLAVIGMFSDSWTLEASASVDSGGDGGGDGGGCGGDWAGTGRFGSGWRMRLASRSRSSAG